MPWTQPLLTTPLVVLLPCVAIAGVLVLPGTFLKHNTSWRGVGTTVVVFTGTCCCCAGAVVREAVYVWRWQVPTLAHSRARDADDLCVHACAVVLDNPAAMWSTWLDMLRYTTRFSTKDAAHRVRARRALRVSSAGVVYV